MSIELMMPSSHLILCHPLLLLPPIPPSIRVFSNESALCRSLALFENVIYLFIYLLTIWEIFTSVWSWLKLMSVKSVMPSNHFILYHPLLLLPSIFPALGSFPMSQFFASGGQSTGISASASVLSTIFRTDFL